MKKSPRSLRPILIGLTSLCLTASLTACGPKVVTRSLPVFPPDNLLQDCIETDVPLVVNKDLVTKIEKLKKDLGVCNADKAGLRAWKDKLSK